MSYPILTTKLQLPRLRSRMLERPALLQRLDKGLADGRPLTLVCAPAGYGKSTLVTGWLAHHEGPTTGSVLPGSLAGKTLPMVAWLSLDEQDDEINRFLAYLAAAIQTVQPQACQSLSQVLNNPRPLPLDSLLALLVNDLAKLAEPIILVLDDVHVLQSESTQRFICMLSENLPPLLHIILISRQEPFLALGRLRSRNLITELRSDDLRFSIDEASRFLSDCMQLELESAWVKELSLLTEGWAAGLQLAGLSMQGKTDYPSLIQNFHHDRHFVIDYLANEILTRLPEDLRKFLLDTCNLKRLCAELCDAVCERNDSRHILEELEYRNLFLIPVDEEHIWYRYHHLFADMLRHQLRLTKSKKDINILHSRTAKWYNDNGFPDEAIEHARSIPDWHMIEHIVLQRSNECFQSGSINLLLEWMQGFPEGIIIEKPILCSDYGWALALTEQHEPATKYLAIAAQAFQNDNNRLGQVLTGQSYLAYSNGDPHGCLELGKQALERLPADNRWMRSVCHLTMGLAYWDLLQLDLCEKEMHAVLHAGKYAAGRNRSAALAYLSQISMVRMNLTESRTYLEQVIFPPETAGISPGCDLAFTYLSHLDYELNRLTEAQQHAEKGLALCRITGNNFLQANLYCQSGRIYRALGRHTDAENMLQEAIQSGRQQKQYQNRFPLLDAFEAELALDHGDLSAADTLISSMEEQISLPLLAYPGLLKARWLIARGELKPAEELLDRLYTQAHNAGWTFSCFRIDMLRTLLEPHSEKSKQLLISCLEKAQPPGLLQPFIDLGKPIREVLINANLRLNAPHLTEFVARILNAADSAEPPAPTNKKSTPAVSSHPTTFEPLTDRELEVLHLLVEETGYDEIAHRLVLSTNTVKSHIKHIYGKLGVSSRREALARARQLKLI